MRRASLVALLTALAVAVASAGPASADTRYAGHWTYYNVITCDRSSPAATLCGDVLGPGSVTRFVNGFSADCNPAGQCIYQSFFLATGSAVGLPPLCGPNVFVESYNGTCFETERGTAAIMQSEVTDLSDFFITSEFANYYGDPPMLNVHDPAGESSYPLDTANPAVPGTYNTAGYLRLIGLIGPNDTPPPGVSFSLVVTHRP